MNSQLQSQVMNKKSIRQNLIDLYKARSRSVNLVWNTQFQNKKQIQKDDSYESNVNGQAELYPAACLDDNLNQGIQEIEQTQEKLFDQCYEKRRLLCMMMEKLKEERKQMQTKEAEHLKPKKDASFMQKPCIQIFNSLKKREKHSRVIPIFSKENKNTEKTTDLKALQRQPGSATTRDYSNREISRISSFETSAQQSILEPLSQYQDLPQNSFERKVSKLFLRDISCSKLSKSVSSRISESSQSQNLKSLQQNKQFNRPSQSVRQCQVFERILDRLEDQDEKDQKKKGKSSKELKDAKPRSKSVVAQKDVQQMRAPYKTPEWMKMDTKYNFSFQNSKTLKPGEDNEKILNEFLHLLLESIHLQQYLEDLRTNLQPHLVEVLKFFAIQDKATITMAKFTSKIVELMKVTTQYKRSEAQKLSKTVFNHSSYINTKDLLKFFSVSRPIGRLSSKLVQTKQVLRKIFTNFSQLSYFEESLRILVQNHSSKIFNLIDNLREGQQFTPEDLSKCLSSALHQKVTSESITLFLSRRITKKQFGQFQKSKFMLWLMARTTNI